MVKLKLYQETQVQALMRHSRLGKKHNCLAWTPYKGGHLKVQQQLSYQQLTIWPSGCICKGTNSQALLFVLTVDSTFLNPLLPIFLFLLWIWCLSASSFVWIWSCPWLLQLHSTAQFSSHFGPVPAIAVPLQRPPPALSSFPRLVRTSLLSNSTNPHPQPLRNP